MPHSANYAIATKDEQAASGASQISAVLRLVTDALLGFAGIAVLVGIFLILNTFSMLVAQRTENSDCCGPWAPVNDRSPGQCSWKAWSSAPSVPPPGSGPGSDWPPHSGR